MSLAEVKCYWYLHVNNNHHTIIFSNKYPIRKFQKFHWNKLITFQEILLIYRNIMLTHTGTHKLNTTHFITSLTEVKCYLHINNKQCTIRSHCHCQEWQNDQNSSRAPEKVPLCIWARIFYTQLKNSNEKYDKSDLDSPPYYLFHSPLLWFC